MRRVVVAGVVLLVAAAPAGADVIQKKQSVDARIADLRDRVQAAEDREAGLQQEIDAVSTHIRDLEQQVGDVSERLVPLEHELELRELKLNRLNALFQDLDTLSAGERADASEIDALVEVSAELAAKIQAAQAHSTVTRSPSAAGLMWPVSAEITSPFGWRWGRMHEGIDLGAPYGSPIAAAAAGTVIYAGWLGGYGNLTVLDHGGGLATAYGHQSRIVVSVGQQVAQGEIIGYVGSTGHSTGSHLHFEVRVNGEAVDPLGYL